jgi:hypothetical protein
MVGNAGVHPFSAALDTGGTQARTAPATTTAGATGSDAGFPITPPAASPLISGTPSGVSADGALSLTNTFEDAYANVVPAWYHWPTEMW